MGAVALPAWGGDKPDFSNPDAVLADIKAKLEECTKAGSNDCVVHCSYAIKTLTNFLKANPEGDPGTLKQRWQSCMDAYLNADLPAPGEAAAAGTPDFADHEAVVAGLKDLLAQCGDDADCIKACGYAVKSMKNFAHPQPHYVGLRKNKWESCRSKVPGMAAKPAKAKPSHDRSKFVVSQLQLGGDMKSQKSRFFLLEAYGYYKKTKQEYSEWIYRKGGATQPGADVVKYYKGTIREEPVYIHFEADADGKVYMIQFKQKESMDVDAVKEALIKRYGKPSKFHGAYLYWGCEKGPQVGFCAKANVSEHVLDIWAFDEDIKKACEKAYEKNVQAAKGIKPGMKF
jgi:hypothetical protein